MLGLHSSIAPEMALNRFITVSLRFFADSTISSQRPFKPVMLTISTSLVLTSSRKPFSFPAAPAASFISGSIVSVIPEVLPPVLVPVSVELPEELGITLIWSKPARDFLIAAADDSASPKPEAISPAADAAAPIPEDLEPASPNKPSIKSEKASATTCSRSKIVFKTRTTGRRAFIRP